jgi:preprotein translocase subunit SecG
MTNLNTFLLIYIVGALLAIAIILLVLLAKRKKQ